VPAAQPPSPAGSVRPARGVYKTRQDKVLPASAFTALRSKQESSRGQGSSRCVWHWASLATSRVYNTTSISKPEVSMAFSVAIALLILPQQIRAGAWGRSEPQVVELDERDELRHKWRLCEPWFAQTMSTSWPTLLDGGIGKVERTLRLVVNGIAPQGSFMEIAVLLIHGDPGSCDDVDDFDSCDKISALESEHWLNFDEQLQSLASSAKCIWSGGHETSVTKLRWMNDAVNQRVGLLRCQMPEPFARSMSYSGSTWRKTTLTLHSHTYGLNLRMSLCQEELVPKKYTLCTKQAVHSFPPRVLLTWIEYYLLAGVTHIHGTSCIYLVLYLYGDARPSYS
jgi:hypothetical protein